MTAKQIKFTVTCFQQLDSSASATTALKGVDLTCSPHNKTTTK